MTTTSSRPLVAGLTVPYVVDARRTPIDFRVLQGGHVRRCAEERRCAICGRPIKGNAPLAFIGPDDGRRCFADAWMHVECARLAMQQCPFLKGRDWRDEEGRTDPLLANYHGNMALFLAPNGRAHRDVLGHWHFEALGALTRA